MRIWSVRSWLGVGATWKALEDIIARLYSNQAVIEGRPRGHSHTRGSLVARRLSLALVAHGELFFLFLGLQGVWLHCINLRQRRV